MSRNKDIAYLHRLTGWDFKTCRLIMKEFKWDLQTVERAYMLSQNDDLKDSIVNITSAVAEAAARLFENLVSVTETVNKAFEELALNIRPVFDAARQNMIECQKTEVIEAAIDEEICRLNHCMPKPESEGINWEDMKDDREDDIEDNSDPDHASDSCFRDGGHQLRESEEGMR